MTEARTKRLEAIRKLARRKTGVKVREVHERLDCSMAIAWRDVKSVATEPGATYDGGRGRPGTLRLPKP